MSLLSHSHPSLMHKYNTKLHCMRKDCLLEGLHCPVAKPFWLGVVVQVRSIGKRDCSSLFKLGDEMIAFNALHQLLASSVADMLPVNVSVLLCDEAKRLARQGNPRLSSAEASPSRQASMEPSQLGSKSFEGLMSSPWKVLLPFSSATLCSLIAPCS